MRDVLIEALNEVFTPGTPLTIAQVADLILEKVRARNEGEQLPAPPTNVEWAHFKGGRYSLMGVCRHTENREQLAVYYSMTDGEMHARPLRMWTDDRFRPIERI
jgi:hypothetical protein